MSSLQFNGTSDFARVAATPAVANPITLSAWGKSSSFTTAGNAVSISASGSSHGWRLTQGGSGTGNCQGGQQGSVGNATATSVNNGTLNAWNHFVATFTSTTSRRSMVSGDSANAGTSSTNSGTTSGPNRTSIGVRDISTPAGFYNGLLAQCAIWNLILTDEEILALALGWSPTKIRTSALVFFTPFLTTTTIVDWYGNHLAVTGGTASLDGPPVALP